MKSQEEWSKFEWENPLMSTGDFIAEIQKDAYNQAIEDVMLNARVKKMFLSTGDYSGYDKYIIGKDSILKLKIK